MRRMFRTGVLAGLVAAVTGVAAAEAAELRVGLITPPNHVWTQASNRFAERISEATGGEVTIQVFPGGQLGSEADMLQQLQSGVLDMAWLTAAVISSRVPSYFGWFTPFLMEDVEAAIAASNTDAARQMLDELDALGIKGQGYMFAGMRHILMRSGSIESETDLANQKVRIYPFPATQVWYQAARAVPTPVGLNEIYQSLDNGLLDGVDIDFDALAGLSLQQVAASLTVTSHMPWPMVAMIDPAVWEGLSPEHQQAFEAVLADTIEWANEEQIRAEAQHLETLRDQITVIELEDAAANFPTANAAFENQFSGVPGVAEFRDQVNAIGN